MKKRMFQGIAAATLAILWSCAGRSDAPFASEPDGHFLTPRVTVTNDHHGEIEVWIVSVDNEMHVQLGEVSSHSTETFEVRPTERVVKLIVWPVVTETDRYVTRVMELGSRTAVRLRVAHDIQNSLVHVSELGAVGCCREAPPVRRVKADARSLATRLWPAESERPRAAPGR